MYGAAHFQPDIFNDAAAMVVDLLADGYTYKTTNLISWIAPQWLRRTDDAAYGAIPAVTNQSKRCEVEACAAKNSCCCSYDNPL